MTPTTEGRRSRLGLSRPLRLVASAALALTVMANGAYTAPQTASAFAPVRDPETNSTTPTGYGWHYGVTPATMNTYINQGNRPVDIEVESASGPTFSAAYVANSGVYARTSWFYPALTAAEVGSKLAANGARAIDVEPYMTGSGLRFAVVMIKNTGDAFKQSWFYVGQTVASISSKASSLGARPIDIDRYVVNGVTYFTVIFIKNTGVDASGWWHYYNVTSAQVAQLQKDTKSRLLGMERIGTDRFDIILQSAGSEYRWWYFGISASQLAAYASQNGARIFEVEPYVEGGVRKFAALMLNNVNAETTRIRELMRTGLAGGVYGAYLKKVGGPTLIDLQSSTVFEPASSIKVVHHLTAIRDRRAANDLAMTGKVTWYANPINPARYNSAANYGNDKNVCAYNNDGTLLTGNTYSDELGSIILRQMMVWSDNRTTDAVVRKYGFAKINETATWAGMTKSKVWHRIGCPGKASPQPFHRNELTLADAGRLYERVQNGTLLGTGGYRTKFYDLMGGGPIGGTSALANIIREEATKLGKSTTIANSFISQTVTRAKGGSYDTCAPSGNCPNPYWYIRTGAGTAWIPFKANGVVTPTAYVYGTFVDKLSIPCTWKGANETNDQYAARCPSWQKANTAISGAGSELFRSVVRDALKTW